MRTNMVNCFGSDQIKSVQNGSNLIKLDQIWISHLSKNVTLKSSHIYHQSKHGQHFLDQIRLNLSKMDQNVSNLDFKPIKKCYYKELSYLRIRMVPAHGFQPMGSRFSPSPRFPPSPRVPGKGPIQPIQSIWSTYLVYTVYPDYPVCSDYLVYNPNL